MGEENVLGTIKRFSLYALLLLFVLSILSYLFTDYKFVGTVHVIGNSYVSEQAIMVKSGLKDDQLFLAIDEHKVQYLVELHPIIKSAKITKHFPNRITIEVVEHKVVGCIEEEHGYVQLFSNGYQEKHQTLTACSGAIITGINAYFKTELLEELVTEFSKIDQITLSLISEIIYSPNDFNKKRLISYMSDGNKVIYSVDTIGKLNYYSDMLHQIQLEYNEDVTGVFDLEVGAYFTPKSSVKK